MALGIGSYNLTVLDSIGCSEEIQFEIVYSLGQSEQLMHQYRIYPVPARDLISVEFITTGHNRAIAEISNLQGRKIQKYTLVDQVTSLNIADLTPGIYILHIEADEEMSDVRIIKLN